MADVGDDSGRLWRQKILLDLRQRNRYQTDTFAVLIQSHNKLLDSSESYRLSNNRLSVEIEKLKAEIVELRLSGGGGGSGSGNIGRVLNESTQVLEHKLFRLQEELTEVHRKRSENAQQVIDLNNTVGEKERIIVAKDAMIKDLQEKVKNLTDKCQNQDQSIAELTTANQMAYSSLELSLRKLQEDNQELVSRWMQQKLRDADAINAENDIFLKKKQEKIRAELEVAASEPFEIPPNPRLSAGEIPAMAYVVSVPTRALQTIEAHEGEVFAVRWAPSGRFFATGGSDRKLKLWEMSAGKCDCKHILIGSNAGITSVDFDTEESLVLAASNDFASRVWSITNQRLMHTLTGHSAKVLAAKFLGDCNRVISGSHDRTLKLWDLRSKACIRTTFAGSCCNDVITLDSNNIVSGHWDKKIRFFDLRSDSKSLKELELDGKVTSLDISSDKTSLLCCTRLDNIAIVDLKTAVTTCTLSADGFKVAADWTRAAFSPDGAYVVAGSAEGSVFVWDVAARSVSNVLHEHHDSVLACSWNPNGQSIVTCDKHKECMHYQAASDRFERKTVANRLEAKA